MASAQLGDFSFCFVPGKITKNTGTLKGNPGVLVINGQRRFTFFSHNKAYDLLTYRCANRLVQGPNKCTATAKVSRFIKEDGSFRYAVTSLETEHKCEIIESKVIAEEMRDMMKEKMRANPDHPVNEAIRAVKFEYAQRFSDSPLLPEIVADLGSQSSLEQMCLRVRQAVIGKSPKGRDEWEPEKYLEGVYGEEHGAMVLDSSKLPDNWEQRIQGINDQTVYNWANLNNIEMEAEEDVEEEQEHEQHAEETVRNLDPEENREEFKCISCEPRVEQQTKKKRDYKCSKCAYEGSQLSNLKRHQQAMHREETQVISANRETITEEIIEDIETVLKEAKLGDHLPAFQDAKIEFQTLLDMDKEDVKELGNELGLRFGEKIALAKLVQKLQYSKSNPNNNRRYT